MSLPAHPLRLLCLGALLVATTVRAEPGTVSITVKAQPITQFRIGSDQQRFGALEFVGGLEMNGSSGDFGGLSAIRLQGGQSDLISITDYGYWFEARIERDADGRPSGIADARMREMTEFAAQKVQRDAEGLAIDGDTAFVSFEQFHRIAHYSLGADGTPTFEGQSPPPVPLHELRRNRGFETIAIAPTGLPFAGALVGIAEMSLDANGDCMAFVRRKDGSSFPFSVKRVDDFDITDGQFLPDGDLVVLERRFNLGDGLAMRLRRIDGHAIASGATVDGEILLEADLLYQIDNMEGLEITIDPDGTPRLTLVSDDNHSILQRNLLLEFRLVGQSD